jgi:hypothetical protein
MSLSDSGSHVRSRWLGLGAISALILASACGTTNDEAAGIDPDTPAGGNGGFAGSGGSGAEGGASLGGAAGTAGAAGEGGGAGSGGTSAFRATPTTYAIHASYELFAFRLCVEVNDELVTQYPYPFDGDHHLPATNFPGIAAGGQVDLEPLLDQVGPSSTVTLHAVRADQPSVVRATPTIGEVDCSKLLYGFEKLPEKDVATFENVELGDDTSTPIRVLIIDGCRPTDPPSLTTKQCGASYDPTTGNLRAHVMGFAPYLTMEPSTTMVYPMHLSPSLAELASEHSLELSYGDLTSEVDPISISNDVPSDTPTMMAGTMTAPATIEEYGTNGFVLNAKNSAGDETRLVEAALANIQRVSSPYDTPQDFFTGANGLLMVFVGDASGQSETWVNADGTWNPSYDGRGLHPLAIPFNFVYGP